jgi:hypothetical protein
MLRRPRTVRCQQCRIGFKVKRRGPVPHYCSHSCRQTAYLARRVIPRTLLAEDLSTAKVRALIREEVWLELRQAGLVSEPPPPQPKKPSKPRFRLVPGNED